MTGPVSTSIIVPPPDVRVTVEKTAAFVAKNGKEFEERIYTTERHNPKFSFVNPNDPYHAYYQRRVNELEEGGAEAIARALSDVSAQLSPRTIAASPCTVDEEPLPKAPSRIPDELEFILELPAISTLDLDVMKLTAQYVAKNGRQFMLNLAQREYRNAQFDFLKTGHSLHRIFTKLLEQYNKILAPTPALFSRLEQCARSKSQMLQSVLDRVAYTRWEEAKRRKEEEDVDRERLAFSMVDWHDFVIADTIDFGQQDRTLDLPKPLDLAVLSNMTLVQRQELWGGRLLSAPAAANASSAEDEMDIDDAQPSVKNAKTASVLSGAEPAANVRHDYVPRALSAAAAGPADPLVPCSICGLQFASSQIQEHIRIEMLDPKWASQRSANLAKHVGSNIVESGSDVHRNLDRLSRSGK